MSRGGGAWIGVGGAGHFPLPNIFPGGQGPPPRPAGQDGVPSERWSLRLGTGRGPWGAERRTQQRKEPARSWGRAPEEPRHREAEVALWPLAWADPGGGPCTWRPPRGGEDSQPPVGGHWALRSCSAQARGTFGSAAGGGGPISEGSAQRSTVAGRLCWTESSSVLGTKAAEFLPE